MSSDEARVALTVEFTRPADPSDAASVEGFVVDDRGNATPFAGWIGLLEILEVAASSRTAARFGSTA